jgi:hypothetical protein
MNELCYESASYDPVLVNKNARQAARTGTNLLNHMLKVDAYQQTKMGLCMQTIVCGTLRGGSPKHIATFNHN